MVLIPGPGGVINETDISDARLGLAPNWMNNLRRIYAESMMTYLARTAGDEVELVSYIEWFMARRDAQRHVHGFESPCGKCFS